MKILISKILKVKMKEKIWQDLISWITVIKMKEKKLEMNKRLKSKKFDHVRALIVWKENIKK